MKIQKIVSICASALLLLTLSPALSSNISAEEEYKPCSVSKFPVPEEERVILISDNSYITVSRGAVITKWVDSTYSIRIQDVGGSCVSSAKVRITGQYSYDSTSNEILSVDLSSQVTYVPPLWTVEVQRSFYTIVGQGITYSINYCSRVDDPYSCLIGGGNWYNQATFTIR